MAGVVTTRAADRDTTGMAKGKQRLGAWLVEARDPWRPCWHRLVGQNFAQNKYPNIQPARSYHPLIPLY